MSYQNDKGITQIPPFSYEKVNQIGTIPKSCGGKAILIDPNGDQILLKKPSCSWDMEYRTKFDKMMLQKWDTRSRDEIGNRIFQNSEKVDFFAFKQTPSIIIDEPDLIGKKHSGGEIGMRIGFSGSQFANEAATIDICREEVRAPELEEIRSPRATRSLEDFINEGSLQKLKASREKLKKKKKEATLSRLELIKKLTEFESALPLDADEEIIFSKIRML